MTSILYCTIGKWSKCLHISNLQMAEFFQRHHEVVEHNMYFAIWAILYSNNTYFVWLWNNFNQWSHKVKQRTFSVVWEAFFFNKHKIRSTPLEKKMFNNQLSSFLPFCMYRIYKMEITWILKLVNHQIVSIISPAAYKLKKSSVSTMCFFHTHHDDPSMHFPKDTLWVAVDRQINHGLHQWFPWQRVRS